MSINDHRATGFLSREQCLDILEANTASIGRFDDDPDRFLKKANAINQTLHENAIAVGDRAKVLGALLLAMAAEMPIRIHVDPTQMVQEVNGNIGEILRRHGKEDFTNTISLTLPATDKNHKAFRKAIVETLQHLREMNVRSAINSGDDALGKFYETFLKYANGAKEMGIVLTPRHIAKFAVEAIGVTSHDRVYDPACGTGGFLVAAMDYVRHSGVRSPAYEAFKETGLWGVEKEDPVYGLALVNMIFRGDGKSGLADGSCFDHAFWWRDGAVWYTLPGDAEPEGARKPFSRVLMNPPFKRKNDPEVKFVDHALGQCKPGALLFSVLPYVVVEGQRLAQWRNETLKRHTVKAVIKFDKNLFYPVQEGTYGLILKVGHPHDWHDKVLMACLFDDQSRPRPSKLLSAHNARDNVRLMTERLRRFLLGKPLDTECLPQEMVVTKLDPDHDCSYCPEHYIGNAEPDCAPDLTDRAMALFAAARKARMSKPQVRPARRLKVFFLMDLINAVESPPCTRAKGYPDGHVPVVSATAGDNGIMGWKDIPKDKQVSHLMSISRTHNTKPCQAFWHPYSFSAIGTVWLLRPREDFAASAEAMLYLCQEISDRNAWRYDYARTVRLRELEVCLPVTRSGEVDIDAMVREARKQIGWVL